MPNWCENDLYVRGRPEELKKFVEFAKGEEAFDFNKFIPYPEKFRELDERAEKLNALLTKKPEELTPEEAAIILKHDGRRIRDGYNQGGYDWCVQNWGN